jgi:ribosome-binding protein aMBF1 (putative translation factor)
MALDTSHFEREFARKMRDPVFRAEFEKASREMAQVDAIVRALDERRQELGCSKAELARKIGKNPAAVRRFFTTQGNPELRTVAALAAALGGEIRPIFPPSEISEDLNAAAS